MAKNEKSMPQRSANMVMYVIPWYKTDTYCCNVCDIVVQIEYFGNICDISWFKYDSVDGL